MSVLDDSNVLLDIFTEDATWFAWSADALERAALTSPLVINRYNLPINWSTHGFVGRFGVEILFLTHR